MMHSQEVIKGTAKQKAPDARRALLFKPSGAILRNETYLLYVAMTKDEAQRRRWTLYEAVIHGFA
jgi:hypothetical protein